MPTFAKQITNNQIVIGAMVAHADSKLPGDEYSAIVDTGSQKTMVSSKVIEDISLPQAGHTGIKGVTGVVEYVPKYKARVDIPVIVGSDNTGSQMIMASGDKIEVVAMLQDLGKFDVLLGMDFLTRFHITMHQNAFILSI
ncbi:MAG: retroviral-like aspartic protease family protein [Aestuariivita sp.]|nr:retroviral-like aspartic protease family protein [Aestuariivita sp.]